MFPVPIPSTHRALPARRESLVASKAAAFAIIEEELRDVRRVNSYGQEEDLRMALSRTISRVEELCSLLKDAYQTQTDLQTELTLAKSNLQLALANNEMLEDALKRDGPGHSKDVGWRRWSAREQKEREMAESRRQSMDSVRSVDAIPPSPAPQSPMAAPSPNPSVPEGRFFKFRFGGGNAGSVSSPGNASPRVPSNMSPHPNNQIHASHLTSASLPSLVPVKEANKEVEELNGQLDKEKEKLKEALAAKDALEAELESLSQALFEEANKMVAEERMKRAEAEEELGELRSEKEALRSALRLVEKERSELNNRVNSPSPELPKSTLIRHTHKRSSSSAIAIKSPVEPEFDVPSRPPTRSTTRRMSIQSNSSTRAPVPAPLDLPQVGLASEALENSSLGLSSSPEVPGVTVELASPPEPSPSPSPTPSGTQFNYTPTKSLPFFDGEESPWANVKSASGAT